MSTTATLLSLKGKTALITGASSGLGAHFARVLAGAGARVAVAARRTAALERLVEEIRNDNGEAYAVAMDVTDPVSVTAAIDRIEAHWGPADILINNAGVADPGRFLKIDQQRWDFVIETNLNGVWRVAHEITQRLVARSLPGAIVNVASILGVRVGLGQSSYSASKAAVIQLTKAMALELAAQGIRVNALCPGYFETEMNRDYFATDQGRQYIESTPAGRAGQVPELDAPLLLLCSDAGSFVNGVALPVDGGHLVKSL
ncbi:3-oxoacyl-ACP reductase [Alcanivorax balearicus MACL04]|uniref:3-oxoacyl-ACP reductase n=1 Tax=Alloalcanivorax balearicus MACL04 TaxID=1177182 RepID=A0ABT2QVZ7_9GAMM|nr:SDR family oxidoreductase [Alloalcanivorax balearicus]MCU5781691.1 3-oxoacyl-ACP reductase [Alloalcanivorax balearicus MACL04]